jgi:hypothetical protein
MEGINKFKKTTVAIVLFFVFGLTSVAVAADFNLAPASGTLGLNQEFSIDLHIDSSGSTINAAQATLAFPSNLIQVESISKDNSIFNFWLQEPEFSNSAGTISFIGGTPSAVSGTSLQVIRINFISKGVGSATISFTDGAITAADGQGTNILETANGAAFTISSTAIVPPIAPVVPGEIPAPVAPVTVATPAPIIRQPTQAIGLPEAPQILVALYPDQDRWYNLISPFNATWVSPLDVTDVATAFNSNPSSDPEISEGLFDSKNYPEIQEDGIYYLHVRFKNNRGWGSTTHYKIAIDTQPPLPFAIQVEGGVSSDNPRPVLIFQTGDALSGIERYLIQIDQNEPIVVSPFGEQEKEVEETIDMVKVIDNGEIVFLNVRSGPGASNNLVTKVFPGEEFQYVEVQDNWYKIQVEELEGWVFGDYVTIIQEGPIVAGSISEYKLPALLPRIYTVSVRAVDKAGNSVEDSVEIEVLPIDSPTIDFYTERVLQKLEVVNVRGSAISNAEVIITMLDEEDVLVLENTVPVDDQGIWNFTLERTLRKETYSITAKTRDERGAISFPTDPIKIKVTDKPLIVIGSLEFSLKNLVFIGIALLIAVAVFFWRDTIKKTLSLQRRSVVAAKDLRNVLELLKQAVANLQIELGRTRINKAQANNAMKQVTKNLEKIDRYVIKDIEEINE